MNKFNPVQLGHFVGTERYYRISRRHLLTDGTKYLAEQAECFWLMDAVASHLMEIGTAEWFVVVKTTVKRTRSVMVYEDGNGNELARREIAYTDLPIEHISLYACWDGEHWVINYAINHLYCNIQPNLRIDLLADSQAELAKLEVNNA